MCIYIYIYVYIYICVRVFTEASLEVKLPTIWTQMKSRDGKSQRTEEKKKEAQKEKVSKHFVFPMICGSGGSKSRLAKAAGAEPAAGQMRWKIAHRCGAKHISKSKCTKHLSSGTLLEVVMSKKCTPLWREAHFQVKMYKTPQLRSTFRSCDVEKVHAVVARSTFRSQHVKNTTCSDIFWKLWRRKSDRRCGAKHISKSTC